MNKIILVTGANKGIGFEIVRQLAGLKHTLLLSARNETLGVEAVKRLKMENLNVHFIHLDVTDSKQREEARKIIVKDFGKLDVLINNAGIGMKGDNELDMMRDEIWETTMKTNAEAPLKLSLLLAPLIPSGGRIINISSSGGSMSAPVGGWSPVYCISKSTLNAITRHLSYYFSNSGILVNAASPGWVKTDLGSFSAPGSVQQGADTPVWLATTETISTGKFWKDRKVIPW